MARTYDSHAITTALGLPRPFDTYAPRTQRRYAKAYREGVSRSEALERERRQRAAQPAARAYKAARRIKRLGINPNGSHDPDNIQRLIDEMGSDDAADRLEAQLAAVEDYKLNKNAARGRAGWNSRQSSDSDDFIDLAPYYFYHPAS